MAKRLERPKNIEVTETASSIYWFDESGIMYSIQKKTPPQSLEEVKEALDNFKKEIGDRKICMLVDVTDTTQSSRENRDYAAGEFPKFVKAVAMVSQSALGKMLANLFFTVKSQPYPTKMFNDEEEAKQWLLQYL